MVNFPVLLEYRMKREERKLAKYDLKKARIDLQKTWAQVDDDTALGARVLPHVVWAVASIIIVLTVFNCTDGVIKERFDQQNVTACEKFVTDHHLVANCANGIIGKTTTDGK